MSDAIIIVFILMAAAMLLTAVIAIRIVRAAAIADLKTKRLYLDPTMGLTERKRLLDKEMSGDSETDFYNYYLIMPENDMPVFHCCDYHLAKAEFLIIEYFEPEKAEA